MMNHRRTTTAVALDELKRRGDQESLRRFLINEQCFPTSKDPSTAPIGMEELKKLVRIWKLNEQRNFWKMHSEVDDIVNALLGHAQQMQNYSTKKVLDPASTKPVPPTESKPSNVSNRQQLGVPQLRNYCGLKYFNRDGTATELTLSSRFHNFPSVDDQVEKVVNHWRSDDFGARDESQDATLRAQHANTTANNNATTTTTGGKHSVTSGIKNKVKIVKQRNLAMHLMNYSAHLDLKKTTFTVKSVQTFINVAECEDPKTVSHCMVAISNIAADAGVRSILFEINAMHKITNMLQHLRGRAAHWAAAMLFYYFSCDKETEDRVYSASSSLLQANGNSKDPASRQLALYTLNNLMPCIDRQRVAELTMRVLVSHFDANIIFQDRELTSSYLSIMQNMAWFPNAQVVLVSHSIMSLLHKFALYGISQKTSSEIALNVGKILMSFLQLPDHATHIINADFIAVLDVLFTSEQEATLLQSLKAAVVLSTLPALRRMLMETPLTLTICEMLINKPLITGPLAKEASKFLNNITLDDASSKHDGLRYTEDGVSDAIFAILRSSNAQPGAKSMAVRALQNVVAYPQNAIKLVNRTLEPMIKVLREQPDHGAAQVLYNLSCVPECRPELVESKIHNKVLEFMVNAKDALLKSAFLQILVQLSSSNVCVLDLLRLELVNKIESQLQHVKHAIEVWRDISLMLLAVVAYAATDLSHGDQVAILRILQTICVRETPDDILENCANVLKFISAHFQSFEELDKVVRTVLELMTGNEEIIDCVSTVLYNMTCTERSVRLMLQDDTYVNVMIRILRNGKAHIQENIAHAMRTLCAVDKCAELLLKHDILSDLIVIALLRTSSEEIKVVCSEAFYNMLCHAGTRLDLLRGDLWWALMRLGRTDSQPVRAICVKALSDLSSLPAGKEHADEDDDEKDAEEAFEQAQRMHALRDHHVLSFMRDLSNASTPDLLLQCLQVVHNLLAQFTELDSDSNSSTKRRALIAAKSKYGMSKGRQMSAARHQLQQLQQADQGDAHAVLTAAHEVVAAIRIGADAFNRAPNLKGTRIALLLMLKCAQMKVPGADREFVSLEVCEALKDKAKNWSKHPECRLHVSRLLFELSRSNVVTKSVSVVDVGVILAAILKVEVTLEIVENCLAILTAFAINESVDPTSIVALEAWPILLREALSVESSILPKLSPLNPLLGLGLSKSRAMTPDTNPSRGSAPRQSVADIRATINRTGSNDNGQTPSGAGIQVARQRTTLYMRDTSTNIGLTPTNALLDPLDACRGPAPNAFRVQGLMLSLFALCIDAQLASKPDQITSAIVQGVTRGELFDSQTTRHNALVVIHAISKHPSGVVGHLLTPETFILVGRYVAAAVGSSRFEKAQEFGAAILRNASLQPALVSRLVSVPNGSLNDYIRDIIDALGGREVEQAALDIAIFFFHTAPSLSVSESGLNPKFVLEMIAKMTANENLNQCEATEAADVANINKYTISMILNQYSFTQGVDPAFVQYMLQYMQSSALATVPDLMSRLSHRHIHELRSGYDAQATQGSKDFLPLKESANVELERFPAEYDQWQAVLMTDVKQNETVILKFSKPLPVHFDRLEPIESHAFSVFSKIIKHYEPVREAPGGGGGGGMMVGVGSAAIEEDENEANTDDDDDEEAEDEGEGDDAPALVSEGVDQEGSAADGSLQFNEDGSVKGVTGIEHAAHTPSGKSDRNVHSTSEKNRKLKTEDSAESYGDFTLSAPASARNKDAHRTMTGTAVGGEHVYSDTETEETRTVRSHKSGGTNTRSDDPGPLVSLAAIGGSAGVAPEPSVSSSKKQQSEVLSGAGEEYSLNDFEDVTSLDFKK